MIEQAAIESEKCSNGRIETQVSTLSLSIAEEKY
jgi:hypothetical protein